MNDEQWIRQTLDEAVSGVEPRDALETIRSRTKVTPMSSKRPWIYAAGGALLATAATITAFAVLGGGTTERGDKIPGPAHSPSATQTATPGLERHRVPAYYLGEVSYPQGENGEMQTAFRLYREWHEVNAASTPASVAAAAVEQMFQPANDPDYASAWSDAIQVKSVGHEGGIITIDLTGPVQDSSVGAEAAELALQQLVYTVQGALAVMAEPHATDPVRILVDGSPISDLWGHVDASEPIARAKATGTVAPIWITEPTDGQAVSMPFTVKGVAQVFEATVSWRVLKDGVEVDSGFTNASEGAPAFGDYSFELKGLDPGQYVLEVFESSALDGSPTFVDTKTITVQ